jgi:hypothetical protein
MLEIPQPVHTRLGKRNPNAKLSASVAAKTIFVQRFKPDPEHMDPESSPDDF